MKELKNNETQTMKTISSREIAGATDKNHDHVMRDIREMCEQAGVTISLLLSNQIWFNSDIQEVIVIEHEYSVEFGHEGHIRKEKEYLLNEMAAELLATGYDVKRRLKVLQLVRKMREDLKEQRALPDFKDPIAGARAWADAMEQKQLAEKKLELSEKAGIEIEEKLEESKEVIKKQVPDVKYVEEVLSGKGCWTATTVAKALGLKSATELNRILHKLKVQYFIDKHWVLYTKYQNLGYAKTRTKTIICTDGSTITRIDTLWTEKGRRFIYNLLEKNNFLDKDLFT